MELIDHYQIWCLKRPILASKAIIGDLVNEGTLSSKEALTGLLEALRGFVVFTAYYEVSLRVRL